MRTGARFWLGAAFVGGVAAAACGGAEANPRADGGGPPAQDGGGGSGSSSGTASGSGDSGGGASSGAGSSGAGGSGGGASSGGAGSSGGTGSSSGSGSGGASSSGGSGGGAPGSQIVFTQCLGAGCGYGSTGPVFWFWAGFFETTPLTCTSRAAGACTVSTCSAYQGDYDSAGTLAIAGGSIPAGTTVDTGEVFDSYAPASQGGTLFTPGQALTVSASGATVPAFGPQSVTAPGTIAVTAPTWAGGSSPTISASSDLALAWTGGQSGATVTFSLTAANQTSRSSMVLSCAWDATSGAGTVPHALLGQMVGYPDGASWYGGFAQQATTTFGAGGYLVALSAVVLQDTQTYEPLVGP
ncbi:MAG TPA: hypothetical protein VGG39_28070 [Polyangiaceae bacterium]|jgi:hypothetical protein